MNASIRVDGKLKRLKLTMASDRDAAWPSEDTIKECQFSDDVALLATTREGAETTIRAYSCVVWLDRMALFF